MTTVGILIFENAEELDVVGPFQVFATAKSEFPELFDVKLISASLDQPVRCANGLRLIPDVDFEQAGMLDVLIIPGGFGSRAAAVDDDLLAWVKQTAAQCKWVGSVCTGARITLAAGLADGKRITTHWSAIEELRSSGRAEVLENIRFVRDGQIVHSAGISAGIDMSLWLVGQIAGDPQVARQVQRMLEYEPAPPYAYLA